MKKFLTLIILVLCVATLFAQAPEKFSYQAVVRNANNQLVTNAPVGVRVSILQGGLNGTVVYMETHTAVTNANSLLTLDIGGGSLQQGVFADIDWTNGLYFLKTEIDPTGGSDYSITNVQQLLSVPYALYSKEAGNGFSGNYNDLTNTPEIPTIPNNVSTFVNDAGYLTDYTETDPLFNAWDKDYNDLTNQPTIPTVPSNVSSFINDAGYITAQDIPAIPTVPTNVSAFVNDAGYLTDYTEQQVLSISNDTLFLTGGSYVKLPASVNCDTTGMAVLLARVDQLERPSISTLSVDNVTCHNADVTGRLINSGVSWISDCGFCWSTVQNPTLANSHITVTTGLGTFNTNLAGLEAGATYYVRAYATNDAGTTYGEELSFTTTSNALPSVTTKTVTNILNSTAVCGGDVTSEGCLTVTARGVCWSTSQNPTISDSHTTDGNGTGSFNSSITGLTVGTTYYVRAYATNSMGTAYGTQRSFTTLSDLPAVTTNTVSNITETTATCGGNVTADGGAMVTARGVCWSTSQHPTINDSHTTDGNGTGAFTSSLTGLFAGITYYVRAYATNSGGTAYGNEISFTTSMSTPVDGDAIPCPGTPTVTDHEGNVYNTVQIGEQCWMKENLRTTTSPSTGTYLIPSTNANYTYTGKQARWYNNDSATYAPMNYGLLYNWNAAVDTFNTAYGETSVNTDYNKTVSVNFTSNRRGICPVGWHLPSDAEWTQLTNYVSSQSEYTCGGNSSYIAKALASTEGWSLYNYTSYTNNCEVGKNPSTNNATGFSAVPAGRYYSSYSSFWGAGESTDFWSIGSCLFLANDSTSATLVNLDIFGKANTSSVRCLRDSISGGGTSAMLPTVTTSAVSNITETSATCGGNVTSDGGATVTARGVCWSTSQNPTVSDSHTTDGSGTGAFTSSLTGLFAGITYYVRAYATNSGGTAYGNEISFTTSMSTPVDGDAIPCPGTPTVTDYDGNTYNTVQIGQQCWIKENLRTTHYSDGMSIPAGGSNTSNTVPYYYDYSSHNLPLGTRGYLYNWPAAIHGAASSGTNPTWVQGICPEGWHLPSDAEWTQMTYYVRSQSEYTCGGNIAKALASTEGWATFSNDCAVGNGQASNNATGFSAVPAGYCNGASFNHAGRIAYFWSSSVYVSTSAKYRALSSTDAGVSSNNAYMSRGFSVRCLRSDPSLSTVITSAVSNITETSATCGGNVTSDGGATVTARGVCWSTSPNPTVNDSHTIDGSGTGAFMSSLTELTAGRITYYVRAYATNSVGTAYGNDEVFTTGGAVLDEKSCQGTPTVTDHEGNVYATVQIGNQCWMRDNLRTTTSPSTGTYLIPAASTGLTETGKQARWYDNDSATFAPVNYGLLYNWNAAVDTFNNAYGETSVNTDNNNAVSVNFTGNRRGICPLGWHLPSEAEWVLLASFVGSVPGYLCGGNSGYIANALSSEGYGEYCAPGYQSSTMNATGFSALMAGLCSGSSSYLEYYWAGQFAGFWSSTQGGVSDAYCSTLDSIHTGMNGYYPGKGTGYSVRCLRDESGNTAAVPTVSTSDATNITPVSATLNGSISNPDNVTITAQGFEWKATVGGSFAQIAGVGSGNTFTACLNNLAVNVSYTFRAFIIYNEQTFYGEEMTFTTTGGSFVIIEDFSAITDSSSATITYSLDNFTQMPGWTGDWVYPSNGKVRLGKISAYGFIQTPALDLSSNGGHFVLSFDAKAWPNDSTSMIVSVNDIPYTVSGLNATTFTTFTLPFNNGIASTFIKFQGFQEHRSRFFLDNVKVILQDE